MRRSFLAGTLGFATLAALAFGAPAFWTSTGPSGGVVRCLAASPSDPQVVYAGVADGGVFRSDDGGDVWRAVTGGLGDFDVRGLAVSPADPLRVLAGTGGGVFHSDDGGATWTAAVGPVGGPIDAVLFDPVLPGTAYAAGSFSETLAKSTDGGVTWIPIGGSVAALNPRVLAIHPTQTTTLYLGTVDDGVHRSDNGGGSWSAVNSGLDNLHVSELAIDPTSPQTIFAGTVNGGVFRSQDGGASWSAFNAGLFGDDVRALAAGPSGEVFLGNLNAAYGLIPGGIAWASLGLGLGWINAFAIGPGAPGRLFVGYGNLPFSAGGIAYSDDRTNFFLRREGLNGVNIVGLAADPFAPSRALALVIGGGLESEDGGASWTFINFPSGLPASLAFDAEAAGVAYTGAAQGFWKSIDGGRTWSAAASGLPAAVIRAILPVPGSDAVVAGTSVGIYRSPDGAASWAAAAGLAAPVYSLAADAASASTLWAGTETGGVFRSLDEGGTWAQTGTLTGIVRALYSSAGIPARLFAGTDSGLFVSTDGGAGWTPVGAGLPAAAVYALVADESRSALYAGTNAGVFENLAGHWDPAAEGLTNPQVRALALLGNGILLAGTQGGSVFQRIEAAERGLISRATGRGVTRTLPPRTP